MSVHLTIFFLILNNYVLIWCFNFEAEPSRNFSIKNKSYFGYSLLLRQGNSPDVIVGAPRQKYPPGGGSIYQCNLKNSECSKLNVTSDSTRSGTIGNWLGGSIVGDTKTYGDIYTCSPKSITEEGNSWYHYGKCYKITRYNKYTIFEPLKEKQPTITINDVAYYRYAFAEAGFHIHYLQKKKNIIIGAVGQFHWSGGFLVGLKNSKIFPTKFSPETNYRYLGYSVAADTFLKNSSDVWYVASAPRDNQLLGRVIIFDTNFTEISKFDGDEMGSYFGASILVEDINGDGFKDILIGAPMAAGETWDEGLVKCYIFHPPKTFHLQKSLNIFKATGSRFGTAISSLGDIDLDGINDIAVSAPYENNGEGAVFIYKGTKNGLSNDYSQKLIPTYFAIKGSVKGFGLGLSNGVDISSDGYNDIAVGAYKTNQVFIFKAKPVIDYELTLRSNVTSISRNNSGLNITYCASFRHRSNKIPNKKIVFKTRLLFSKNVNEMAFNLLENTKQCRYKEISVEKDWFKLPAINIQLEGEVVNKSVVGIGENVSLIVLKDGCGTNNTCESELKFSVELDRDSLIVGQTETILGNFSIENKEEQEFNTVLLRIELPTGITLKNDFNFIEKNNVYEFTVTANSKYKPLTFFVTEFDYNITNLDLKFFVISGKKNPLTVTKKLNIVFNNSLNSVGQSDPNNFGIKENNTVFHTFTIANNGPGSAKINIILYVPKIIVDSKEAVTLLEPTIYINKQNNTCSITNTHIKLNEMNKTNRKTLQDRLLKIDCHSTECTEITCSEQVLSKSDTAKCRIGIIINTNQLVKKFEKELSTKNIIEFSTIMFLKETSKTYWDEANTKIFASSTAKTVPLWILIVSAVIALIILALIIFALYKFHFFDRQQNNEMEGREERDTEEEVLVPNSSYERRSITNNIYNDL